MMPALTNREMRMGIVQTMAIPEEEAHFFGSVALGLEVSFCFLDCRKLP